MSVDDFKDLFSVLGMIRRVLGIIELNENGNDIWIGPLMPGVSHTSLNLTDPMIENDQGDFGECCYFFADLTAMRTEADNFLRCSEKYRQIVNQDKGVKNHKK